MLSSRFPWPRPGQEVEATVLQIGLMKHADEPQDDDDWDRIPISQRRTPRMDFTSFSDCLRNVSGLAEFRAASATVRPGDGPH